VKGTLPVEDNLAKIINRSDLCVSLPHKPYFTPFNSHISLILYFEYLFATYDSFGLARRAIFHV